MKSIIKFLIFSNTYLAICVLGLYLAFSESSLSDRQKLPLEAFIFFATIAVYSLLRIRVLQYDISDPSAYVQWLRENIVPAKMVRAVSVAATLMLFPLLTITQQTGIFSLGLVWILYNLPIFSGGKIKFGLRYVWFLKPFVVGFIVAGLTTLVPLLDSSLDLIHIIAAMSISFVFASSVVVIFEIKDINIDRSFSTDTIPIRTGIIGTKIITLVLLLLCAVLTFIFFGAGSTGLTLLKISPIIALAFYVYFFIKEDTNDYVYWIVIDGWMWLVGLLWYLINHHIILLV